jgi:hypothetical protein|tara:strand:- start:8286 stop:8444 length:159 start_codon:yes stop_codon:yes gene_type:complete
MEIEYGFDERDYLVGIDPKCKGTTKRGEKCFNRRQRGDRYCFHHRYQNNEKK